jgi:hypothetical protein
LRNSPGINRLGERQVRIVILQITGVTANFPDQALGRITGVLGNRRPDHRAERKVLVVDGKKIEHVARLPPAGRGQRLISRDVDHVQD